MFDNIWKEKKAGSSGVSEFGVIFIIKGPLGKIVYCEQWNRIYLTMFMIKYNHKKLLLGLK